MEVKATGPCYRVLLKDGEAEIVEKKSRFIATLRRVETQEEANAFIEEMKKRYWDARHNCSAFVIGAGGELTRCSDDGEPAGTAGRPMLEVLLGEGIRNAAVVVTRYFGGVLLGTGGLVRAYSRAVKAGLEAAGTGLMRPGLRVLLTTDYTQIGKILYHLGESESRILSSCYEEEIRLELMVPREECEGLEKRLTDATGAHMTWRAEEEIYFIDKQRP